MEKLNNLITLLENINEPIYLVDENRNFIYFNKYAEELTGFTSKELIGTNCSNNILNHVDEHGNSLCIGLCPLAETIKDCICISNGNLYLHHKKGHRVPISVRTVPYKIGDDIYGVEIFTNKMTRDFSLEQRYINKNTNLYDPLTKLLNREFLKNHLKKKLDSTNKNYALLFLDLDGFKEINDKHGHLFGDKVLITLSNTLVSNTNPDEFVIRFGGDEFLVFVDAVNKNEAYNKALKLQMLINNTYIRTNRMRINVSIGIQMVDKSRNLDEIINESDSAMYVAKNSNINEICFYK